MRHDEDGMRVVRAELCERLASLSGGSRPLTRREFGTRVGTIRALASAYGLSPVVRLAEALERAVAESNGRGLGAGPTGLYLARLQDAIGCERLDDKATEALLASVSVRLGA